MQQPCVCVCVALDALWFTDGKHGTLYILILACISRRLADIRVARMLLS